MEEQQDLSALKGDIPTSESKTLARSFGSAKVFIPQSQMANFHFMYTMSWQLQRSHSDVPDKPPFESIAGVMADPIDRLEDIFPKEE